MWFINVHAHTSADQNNDSMYIQSLKDAFPKQCRQWEQYEDFSQKTLTDACLVCQHLHSQFKKSVLYGV